MKTRQIIKINFIDCFIRKEMRKQQKSYKERKEQDFKEKLKHFLNSILFTPRYINYPSASYDDCLKQFIYDVLIKESISTGIQEFEAMVTDLMNITYNYSLKFLYAKECDDDYNGKVYCIIKDIESDFIICAYHIGDGLYLKNMIYLLHEKYKNATTRTLFWFAYKYFCGLIIDHALNSIKCVDWSPDNSDTAYFFSCNSATPININEFIKNKELIFDE